MYVYLYMYFMCVKRIGILYKSEMRSIKASYYYLLLLYDGALTLKMSKMALNPFCDKTIHIYLLY